MLSQEVIDSAKAGDKSAVDTVVREAERIARSVAASYRVGVEKDDVVQRAVLKFWKWLPEFRGDYRQLRACVRRILYRTLFNAKRQLESLRACPEGGIASFEDSVCRRYSEASTPLDRIIVSEKYQRMMRVAESINQRTKEVVEIYASGGEISEISERFGISQDAARGIITRYRNRCKELGFLRD